MPYGHIRQYQELVEQAQRKRLEITRRQQRQIAELFRQSGCGNVSAEPEVGKAFEKAYEAKAEGLLFCVGSLYLAGEVKDWIAKRGKEAPEC